MRPEVSTLQLLQMQTQLSQSGLLPSTRFLYLALRKAQKITAQQAAPCRGCYLQQRTNQCISNMQQPGNVAAVQFEQDVMEFPFDKW